MPQATQCLSLELLLLCACLSLFFRPQSLSISSQSALWQLASLNACNFFFSLWFYSAGPASGSLATGQKPLTLLRDFTSHSVWRGGPSYCFLHVTGAPSEGGVYMRSSQRCMEVNVVLDMVLWHGGGGAGWEGRRGEMREKKMEMYGRSDRPQIWRESGKGDNDWEGGVERRWSGKEDTEMLVKKNWQMQRWNGKWKERDEWFEGWG